MYEKGCVIGCVWFGKRQSYGMAVLCVWVCKLYIWNDCVWRVWGKHGICVSSGEGQLWPAGVGTV